MNPYQCGTCGTRTLVLHGSETGLFVGECGNGHRIIPTAADTWVITDDRESGAISATPQQMAGAFTEWERRYREDPDKFYSEQDKLSESEESYGEACAPYFISILVEQGVQIDG